jgi:hypothetical protein
LIELSKIADRHRVRSGDRARLRQSAEARVETIAWGSGSASLVRPEPFWAERMGDAPERLRSTRRGADATEYGRDADGEIVLARQYLGGDEPHAEWFRLDDGGIWFYPDEVRLDQVVHENGRLAAMAWYMNDRTWSVETYEHDEDGRIVAIDVAWPGAPGSPGDTERLVVEYDADGELAALDSVDREGARTPRWVRLRRKVGDELADLERDLLRVLEPLAAGDRVLALLYEAQPSGAPGVQTLDLAALSRLGGELGMDALAPANWDSSPETIDDQVGARFLTVARYLAAKRQHAKGRRLLHTVARRLNERLREQGLTGLVYAVDTSGERLEKDLTDSLLPEQLRQVRELVSEG